MLSSAPLSPLFSNLNYCYDFPAALGLVNNFEDLFLLKHENTGEPYTFEDHVHSNALASSSQSLEFGHRIEISGSPLVNDGDNEPSSIDYREQEPVIRRQRSWSTFKKSLSPLVVNMDDLLERTIQLPRKQSLVLPSNSSCKERGRISPQSPPRSLPELSYSASSSEQEDSEDPGDEEYMPSPAPSCRKRRRSSSTSPRLTFPILNVQTRPIKRLRGSPPSRNEQACAEEANQIKRMVLSNDLEKANFVCPFQACGYRQNNRRMPDFKRHVETHLRTNKVRCNGVPANQAALYPGIPSDAEPYWLEDKAEHWIGGCLRTFSRADALKRHIDNRHNYCVGHRH